jgi:5-methyltetrahydropteroyltriglutamate--homocysteine methyltransferase
VKSSRDRILTTHTGSLPRPDSLLQLLTAKAAGELKDTTALEALIASCVREVVRHQLESGLDIINDGEASKLSYVTYVSERLEGFNAQGAFVANADLAEFPEYAQRLWADEGIRAIRIPACGGPVSWKNRDAFRQDISRFKTALAGQRDDGDAFMTAASPGVIALFMENKHYPSEDEYLYRLADLMREEYEAIVEAGLVLQVDCPDLACGRHSRFADLTLAQFRKVLELHIDVLNHALANIPPDRVRMHLCWGNYEGPHNHDVPLSDIIEPIFRARVGAISFEAANPRHEHEWAVFKDVKLPVDKMLIPGVIDTSTNYIEHPDLVAERIVRFAELVGRENVIAGCDCGFATFASSLAVVPTIVWAKLRSLTEGARIASKQLWRQ